MLYHQLKVDVWSAGEDEPMKKDKFIAKTAAKIFAEMFANPEKDPSAAIAVDRAIEIWEQLIAKNIIDPFEN